MKLKGIHESQLFLEGFTQILYLQNKIALTLYLIISSVKRFVSLLGAYATKMQNGGNRWHKGKKKVSTGSLWKRKQKHGFYTTSMTGHTYFCPRLQFSPFFAFFINRIFSSFHFWNEFSTHFRVQNSKEHWCVQSFLGEEPQCNNT